MWHDVLGTDEYYPLCRMWPNRSMASSGTARTVSPRRRRRPRHTTSSSTTPSTSGAGFWSVVFHCLVLGLLFTLSKKVRDKRERTREHYYYSWRSMSASGILCCCNVYSGVGILYGLLPLSCPKACDKYTTAVVPEGGGGPSLLDDGKSTLAQYYAALIELIQACTWAIGLPLKMAMSRADFLAATRIMISAGGVPGLRRPQVEKRRAHQVARCVGFHRRGHVQLSRRCGVFRGFQVRAQ